MTSGPMAREGDARRRRRAGARLALAFVFLCAPAGAEECWTNLTGHVLKALPLSVRDAEVTFACEGSNRTLTCPLSVFRPEEQERLRCRVGDTTLPEGLRSAYEFSGRVITRSRLLCGAGTLSEEACRRAVSGALDAFRQQAAPYVERKQLSSRRLELIVNGLAERRKSE